MALSSESAVQVATLEFGVKDEVSLAQLLLGFFIFEAFELFQGRTIPIFDIKERNLVF